jgi:hypothetical protein
MTSTSTCWLAVLVVAEIVGSNASTDGSAFPPGCVGHSCASNCTALDCGAGCVGHHCASDCIGVDCGVGCIGDECAAGCSGGDCGTNSMYFSLSSPSNTSNDKQMGLPCTAYDNEHQCEKSNNASIYGLAGVVPPANLTMCAWYFGNIESGGSGGCVAEDSLADCTGDRCAYHCGGHLYCGVECNGDGCAALCQGNNCGAGCNGTICAQECVGDDCGAQCTEEGCANGCQGKNCGVGCIGESCAYGCAGENCGTNCIGDECAYECSGVGCGSNSMYFNFFSNTSNEKRMGLPCSDYDNEHQCEKSNDASIYGLAGVVPPANLTMCAWYLGNADYGDSEEGCVAEDSLADCTGDHCAANCGWDDCGVGCNGRQCARECVGDDCGAGCIGTSCALLCGGDDCGAQCIGYNCAMNCVGNDCGAGCIGHNCAGSCSGNGCGAGCIGDSCAVYCNRAANTPLCGKNSMYFRSASETLDEKRMGLPCSNYDNEHQCEKSNNASIYKLADVELPTNLTMCVWYLGVKVNTDSSNSTDSEEVCVAEEFLGGVNCTGTSCGCIGDGCASGCEGDDCGVGCIGFGCANGCQGNNCGVGCNENACANLCRGDDCGAQCIGVGCAALCQGNNCGVGCNGTTCASRCRGDDCGVGCIGVGCAFECHGNKCGTNCIGDKCAGGCRGVGCGTNSMYFKFGSFSNTSNEKRMGLPCSEYDNEHQCEKSNDASIYELAGVDPPANLTLCKFVDNVCSTSRQSVRPRPVEFESVSAPKASKVGAIVGAFAGAMLLLLVGFFLYYKRRKGGRTNPFSSESSARLMF